MRTSVLISRGMMSAWVCALVLLFSSCSLMKYQPRYFVTGNGSTLTDLKKINARINNIQLGMSPQQVRQIMNAPEMRSLMEDANGVCIETWSYSVVKLQNQYNDVVEYILRFENDKLVSMDSHKYIKPDKPGIFVPAPYINSTTTVSK